MTVAEATALLTNPEVLVETLSKMEQELASTLRIFDFNLEVTDSALVQRIRDARGEVRGVNRVKTLLMTALGVLRTQKEEEANQKRVAEELKNDPVGQSILAALGAPAVK
jgi:hypothetical protein